MTKAQMKEWQEYSVKQALEELENEATAGLAGYITIASPLWLNGTIK